MLAAVAEGLPSSTQMARELVAAVLGDVIVRRAMQLEVLLREGSPRALVRAVELAEVVLMSNTKDRVLAREARRTAESAG